jgi:hypothetical protein
MNKIIHQAAPYLLGAIMGITLAFMLFTSIPAHAASGHHHSTVKHHKKGI